MRFIPKDTKVKMRFYKHITVLDIILGLVIISVFAVVVASNLPFKFLIGGGILCVCLPLFLQIGNEKIYMTLWYMLRHLFSIKKYYLGEIHDTNELLQFQSIENNQVVYKDKTKMSVLQIKPFEFGLLSKEKQDFIIDGAMTNIFNFLSVGQIAEIVKLDKPLNLDNQLEKEAQRIKDIVELYEQGNLTQEEYRARINIIEDRGNTIEQRAGDVNNTYSAFYFVIYDKDKIGLQNTINYIRQLFLSSNIEAKQLDSVELQEFINLSRLSTSQKVEFNLTKTIQDDKQISHFAITNFPLNVGNAWGLNLFDLSNCKVSMRLNPVDKQKAVKRIDNAVTEMSSRRLNKASEQIAQDTHLETLSALLNRLQNGNETLLDCTILITIYDEVNQSSNKKLTKQRLKELGFGYTECIGRQYDAYLTQGFVDKLNISRGIQSSTIAASFPFVSNAIVEENGLLIGQNDLPVFVDFFKRDSERVNSNMIIVGKPGSGKSYATKSLLTNLASTGAKVLVIDPENEYGKLAKNLGGKELDVASNMHGIINPFEIIYSLSDEKEKSNSNNFYAHLRFLEQFLKTTFVGLNSDCLEILNKIILETYANKGINETTNINKLKHTDYPTFDEIAQTLSNNLENEHDSYTQSCLKNIQNYLIKFCTGGRNSSLWNGYSSIQAKENFVAFNFQKLLADKNDNIANAQMLLVLKWIENEIIKNRENNLINNTNKKIVVAIDEAHLFINEQYPIALDFMFQLAKRIRKYDGMQIVITQNIKDFVGTPEISRKSTAIINVSQYSLIFSLSPSDMIDLCKLYEKAGEINESEQASIVYNPRGRAFFIYGASSRTNIEIETTDYVEHLFV